MFLASVALDRIADVPAQLWLILIAAVAVLVIGLKMLSWAFRVWRLLTIIVTVVSFSIVFANWCYNRNEPRWATPLVGRLAEWLPHS